MNKDSDGSCVSKVSVMESNDDWLRAARLKKLADQGDEEARKEFVRMDSTPVVMVDRTPEE